MASIRGLESPTVLAGPGLVEGTGKAPDDVGSEEVNGVITIRNPGDGERGGDGSREVHVRSVPLRTGGRLEVGDSNPHGAEEVRLRAPDGEVLLRITITEEGPHLHFRAAALHLESEGTLRVDCEDLEIKARGSIDQRADGDLVQRAGGEFDARGDQCQLIARRGDVRVWANDDVRLNGERVKLNC